ncbi:hypothetical protein AIOL_003169 [Candidatus Rhodobacter oscarellae]|uniref:CENP-V/GFA domain-containing protein n=1 Tax=Candidatus Rhodobacter oscarellae TaxID=1675527 RepID=A0A0J9GXI9_9RHOB|nr:hypothetical protein [Candidatus Rhodobacter lobularis]KMW58198.1 hypothetical protein AIOL_003169 [Candidatus Rhodobacter lobularis]
MLKGTCLCGQVGWRYDGAPDQATVCNCGACRRYGAIWIYGNLGEQVFIDGETRGYVRTDAGGDLAFHTCPTCGVPHSWQPAELPAEGGYRLAVNLRLAEQEEVAQIPLRRFDGRDSWSSLPDENRCVADIWHGAVPRG